LNFLAIYSYCWVWYNALNRKKDEIIEFGPNWECDGVGTGDICFLWGTAERLPFYYALMNNQVIRRENEGLLWSFTPEVYIRSRSR